jgi:hypothetical protein
MRATLMMCFDLSIVTSKHEVWPPTEDKAANGTATARPILLDADPDSPLRVSRVREIERIPPNPPLLRAQGRWAGAGGIAVPKIMGKLVSCFRA